MVEWVNDDGLLVRFGLDQAVTPAAGKPSMLGMKHELVIKLVATDITAQGNSTRLLYREAGLPQKALIEDAILYVTTVWTGSSSTLRLGLWHDDGDGTFTVEDENGFVDALVLNSLDSVGAKNVLGGAYVAAAGAAGTDVVPNDSAGRDLYVGAGFGTAVFTAGEGLLVIRYIPITD